MARPSYIKNPTVEGKPNDPVMDREKYRGFMGKAVKVHIYNSDGVHDHADPWVSLSLGDLPTVWVARGIDWIIPLEYLSVLQDTAVQTVEHRALRRPKEDGNIFEETPKVLNRFQFQVLGEVPWEEYEAFRSKLRKDVFNAV